MAENRTVLLRPAAPEPATAPSQEHKPRRRAPRHYTRWTLLALGPIAVILGAGFAYLSGGRYVDTDDAYVKTDIVSINAQASGQLVAIHVHDNQAVKTGELLFELDPKSYQIAVKQAEANMAAIADQIAVLRASYLEKQAALQQAQATAAFQQREYERQSRLSRSGVASEQKLDQTRHDLEQAQQQIGVIRQQLAGIRAQLGGSESAPKQDLAQYQVAMQRVEDAKLALARTKVFAPADGVVANVKIRPGDYVNAGTPVFSLAEVGHVWIEANFKETELTYVAAGQPATVTVDTFPGTIWRGNVASLSPASGGEFSVLPAQNASGNWVKVVQRIPVRIVFENANVQPQLRAGMSVSISIDTSHRRTLAGLWADFKKLLGLG